MPSAAEREFRQRLRERAAELVKSQEETDVIKAYDKAKAQLTFEDAEVRRKREEEKSRRTCVQSS